MRLLNSLFISSHILNVLAFHSNQDQPLHSFGPSIPSAFFRFDSLLTLKTPKEDVLETRAWLAQFLESNFGIQYDIDYQVTDLFMTAHNNVEHIHLRQVVNGIPIENALMNLNIRANSVLSIGSSFIYTNQNRFTASNNDVSLIFLSRANTSNLSITPVLSPVESLISFTKHINQSISSEKSITFSSKTFVINNASFAKNDIPVELKYIYSNGELILVWDLQIEMENNWINVHVDSITGTVVSVMDWVSHASYTVYPLGTNDPLMGERSTVIDPAHFFASPDGWHVEGNSGSRYSSTRGNNVIAQENLNGKGSWENNHRPSSVDLNFDYELDLSGNPDKYLDSSITNLFYWNNIMHDLFYVYGFDEVSGNFQQSSLRGGKGNDAVIANAQDGSGFNNANFATPPDGQSGRMRMYIWDVTDPHRDGDLESGIIIHEYSHGISTRLTGGPANSNCLGWGESGGMGEGWGDFHAIILQMTTESKRTDEFKMGGYANGGKGIRKFPYSTNMSTNPSTYAYIAKPEYNGVHAKGEVWAVILYEVYWNMVEKYGFTSDWYSISKLDTRTEYIEIHSGLKKKIPKKKPVKLYGNLLMLQLVVDGMKMQPCRPSFVDARNAIIEADKVNNKGVNKCVLWIGFAKRGLGIKAKSSGKENFDIPEQCHKH